MSVRQHIVRLGRGELDDGRHRFETLAAAWTIYLQVAAKTEPCVISSLLTDEAFEAERRTREFRESWVHKPECSNMPVRPEPDDPLECFIQAWCTSWGFQYYFAHIPAINLIVEVRHAREEGRPEPETFTCDTNGNPTDGRSLFHIWSFAIRDGKKELLGQGDRVSLILPDLRWEPTTETVSGALDRLMGEIRPIVRDHLHAMRDGYIAHGYQPVHAKDDTQHFEWLARYQILRERKPDIAHAEGVSERHVRRELESAARLLGIHIRPPKRGRPRRKTGHTVKIRKPRN